LCNDNSDCIKDRFVLIAHSGHGINLEAATKNIAELIRCGLQTKEV